MMLEFAIITVTNILLAVTDGLYDSGKKKESKLVELTALAGLFTLGYYTTMPILLVAAAFALIRFGVFNISYNLTRGLHVLYVGTTDYVDLVLKKVNPGLYLLWYLVAFLTGFGLLNNHIG